MLDLTESIAPRSDQMNAEDLLTGPRTFTVKGVREGSGEQPFDFYLEEFPRPFRPSKTVRRIFVTAWGADASTYTGRRMTLYRDPDVKFGGQAVGGIRVSHLSHIDKPLRLALTETRGKRATHVVQPLADDAPTSPAVPDYMADARAAKTVDGVREVWLRADAAGHLTDALKAELTARVDTLKIAPDAKPKPAQDPPTEPPLDADWPAVTEPGGER